MVGLVEFFDVFPDVSQCHSAGDKDSWPAEPVLKQTGVHRNQAQKNTERKMHLQKAMLFRTL